MNCDTGRFENFNSGDDIKPPWREWSVDELIVVKDENTKKLVMSRLLVGNRSGGVLVHKNQIDILSAGRIKAMQGRRAPKTYTNIYVDEPIICFDSKSLFDLYALVADRKVEQTFIFLGL